MKSARLSKLLSGVQKKLTLSIPERVRQLQIESPAYCLFIWYQDFSTDEYTPRFYVAPAGLREACLSEADLSRIGGNALDAIWRPQQTIQFPYNGFELSDHPCGDVTAESNEFYSAVSEEELPGEEEGGEGALLAPFRRALHKATRKLNVLDWTGILPRSQDFVVLATDYIGYWFNEDVIASIPRKQLKTLVSRGLLSDDALHYDEKAAVAALEAEEKAAIERELQKPGMVRCPNSKCGKAISSEARRCPYCYGPGPRY